MSLMSACGSFTPGNWTTTLPPWESTVDPDTPAPSTRLRMMFTVVAISPLEMGCAGL